MKKFKPKFEKDQDHKNRMARVDYNGVLTHIRECTFDPPPPPPPRPPKCIPMVDSKDGSTNTISSEEC